MGGEKHTLVPWPAYPARGGPALKARPAGRPGGPAGTGPLKPKNKNLEHQRAGRDGRARARVPRTSTHIPFSRILRPVDESFYLGWYSHTTPPALASLRASPCVSWHAGIPARALLEAARPRAGERAPGPRNPHTPLSRVLSLADERERGRWYLDITRLARVALRVSESIAKRMFSRISTTSIQPVVVIRAGGPQTARAGEYPDIPSRAF